MPPRILLLLLTLFFGGISLITVPVLTICTQHNICPYMLRLHLMIKWDSSCSTPVLEQICMVRMFGSSGVDPYFFSWKKSFQNKFKRISLDGTHCDIVGSQWPTSASNISQCVLPWMCHCATLTDKPQLPQTSSSSSTGISLTLLRLKGKLDLALKEKLATSPLENYIPTGKLEGKTVSKPADACFVWLYVCVQTNFFCDELQKIKLQITTDWHQTPWLWCHS